MKYTLYLVFRPRTMVIKGSDDLLPEMENATHWSMSCADRSPWTQEQRCEAAKLAFLAKMRIEYGRDKVLRANPAFDLSLSFFDKHWTVEILGHDDTFEDVVAEIATVDAEREVLAGCNSLLRSLLE